MVQQSEFLSIPERQAILDREVAGYVRQGYQVQMRTETTAQLVRPKRFSIVWALLWTLAMGVGLLVYIIYYVAKREGSVYLEVDPQGKVSRR